MVRWYNGMMVQWYNGTMVRWYDVYDVFEGFRLSSGDDQHRTHCTIVHIIRVPVILRLSRSRLCRVVPRSRSAPGIFRSRPRPDPRPASTLPHALPASHRRMQRRRRVKMRSRAFHAHPKVSPCCHARGHHESAAQCRWYRWKIGAVFFGAKIERQGSIA